MSDADVIDGYTKMLNLNKHMNTIEDNYVLEGQVFTAYFVSTSIASGGTYDLGILTGDTGMIYMPATIVTSSDSVTIGMYESSVISGGTTLSTANKNRNYSNVSTCTLKTTPTVTTTGTLINSSFIGGVTGNPQTRQGGVSSSGGTKQVLKPNAQYVLRFTNGSSNVNTIRVKMEWIESV